MHALSKTWRGVRQPRASRTPTVFSATTFRVRPPHAQFAVGEASAVGHLMVGGGVIADDGQAGPEAVVHWNGMLAEPDEAVSGK
jgi:hypothetical protein